MMRCWRNRLGGAAAAAALLAGLLIAAGCSADGPERLSWPPYAIAGTYHSAAAVGTLGVLKLTLTRIEESRVFEAELTSRDDEAAGVSEGIGTLGNAHLILNFDRGFESDYYFEGVVTLEGDTPRGLSGAFIFPDQPEPLPVVFAKQ